MIGAEILIWVRFLKVLNEHPLVQLGAIVAIFCSITGLNLANLADFSLEGVDTNTKLAMNFVWVGVNDK